MDLILLLEVGLEMLVDVDTTLDLTDLTKLHVW